MPKSKLRPARPETCTDNRWVTDGEETDGDNHAVTFKITTPLYVIGKKNDSERVRLGKTFVFSPPRTHRTDIFIEIGPQRAAVF